MLTNYDGSAKIRGKEIRDWGAEFYEEVGVSFEFPNHHQRLTALENLQHFGSLYSGEIIDPMEVLKWVDLHEHADKRVSDFSKGMKIRLNVARSLLHRPKILFLDEPTSGLDPVNAKRVKELVFKVRDEGTTVFLTTHDMNVADDLCDRVAFINDGEIAAIDSPVARTAPIYRSLGCPSYRRWFNFIVRRLNDYFGKRRRDSRRSFGFSAPSTRISRRQSGDAKRFVFFRRRSSLWRIHPIELVCPR